MSPAGTHTDPADQNNGDTGPRRTQRQRRTLANAPYNAEVNRRRRTLNSGSGDATNARMAQAGFQDLCPRRGIQWIASSKQPHAVWETMLKPHEKSNTSVVNFLLTLTASNVREDMVQYCRSELLPQSTSPHSKSDRSALYRHAKTCREMDHRRNGYDFHSMISLIRLCFECAR